MHDARSSRSVSTAYALVPAHDFMMTQVDQDGSKEIEFSEFVRAIQINKSLSAKSSSEHDTIDAFVALGGNVSSGKWPTPNPA